jgi:hypothetical protein
MRWTPLLLLLGCSFPAQNRSGGDVINGPDIRLPEHREPASILPIKGEGPSVLAMVKPVPAKRSPPAVAGTTTPRRHRSPLLCTPEQEKLFRSFWPRSNSEKLNALRDRDLVFYDESDLGRIYQVWDQGGSSGLRDANDIARQGNLSANNEFPWRDPAGLVRNSNYKVIRFFDLPDGQSIEVFPVPRADAPNLFGRYGWRFPNGTTFGEILLMSDPGGTGDWTFEVRLRRKVRDGLWSPDSFRPYPTEDSLRRAMATRGFGFEPFPAFAQSIDSGQQRDAFIERANFVSTPMMPPALVQSLLGDDVVFQSARGKEWRAADSIASPTTEQVPNIVPRGFVGAFVPVDTDSCMRCHEHAGTVVNLTGEQRWRLRGNDGIFTFHPFRLEDVGPGQLNPKFNEKLVAAGIVKPRGIK